MSRREELLIHVFGRVQGVGFRQYVKKQADFFALKGFVRNESDGSVLIIAQGSRAELEPFLRAVKRGPPFSKVGSFSYAWKVPSQQYDSFVITVDTGFIDDQAKSFANLGKELLNLQKAVPSHVAIIPDGNRRWAQSKGLSAFEGHSAGNDRLRSLLDESKKLGIKYITIWGFSTDNWKREGKEVKALMNLFKLTLKDLGNELIKQKVNFRHIGRKDRLPKEIVKEIHYLEKSTQDFTDRYVALCIDYGGRDELVRAINKLIASGVKEVKEEDISRFLDTEGIPDPDLIIRTSGEHRTSGFMPFQTTYSELYFADCYFPDFGPAELRKAVEEFGRRKRRFGN